MARCSFHRALLICLLLPGAVHAQVLPFTHYTPDSDRAPLPSADVQQVYQDRLGYIWMVVYSSGLARYDGVTLDLYTTDDGLKDLNLRDVLEDSLGRLWVASEAGLVVSEKPLADYANGSRIRFTALIGQTPLLDVATYKNRIAADEQGWLWVGTDGDGIIRYRVDNLQQTTTDTIRTALYDERQNLTVRSIAVRRSGSIWVGLSGGRLLVFDDDAQHFEVFSRNEEPAFDYTAVLYESPSGILWGGENNGHLWRLEEADGKQSIITVSTELASGLASIMSSGDRMLWAASARGV
jgi:ligand-binding sensor domain-containing protein